MVGSISSIAIKELVPSLQLIAQSATDLLLAVRSVLSGSGSGSLLSLVSLSEGSLLVGCWTQGDRNRGSNRRAPLELSCGFSQRTHSRSLGSSDSGLGTKHG